MKKLKRYLAYKSAKLVLYGMTLEEKGRRIKCKFNGGVYLGTFTNILTKIKMEKCVEQYEEEYELS
jgi:hypothetical protein